MDTDDIPPQRLRFDELTRKRLLVSLRKAIAKNGDGQNCDERSELLVSILEGFSDGYHTFDKFKPESQERRRERLVSIAQNLEGIAEQLKKLDGAASEYACFLSFNELVKLEDPNHITPDTWNLADITACASFIDSLPQTLAAFAVGLRFAEKTLPLHSYNTSGMDANWYSAPPQLAIALALERQFWEFGLKYTVTNTGLAANCLQAIYSCAGIEVKRVDYWLKQARDHKDSMASLANRQKGQEK